MQKTKIEIIYETVEFYGADLNRRSKKGGGICAYNGDNGTHCAVGRLVTNAAKMSVFEGQSVTIKNFDTIESLFKDEYKGHDLDFWKDIQSLHDYNSYWDTTIGQGLSVVGKHYVYDLKNKYK